MKTRVLVARVTFALLVAWSNQVACKALFARARNLHSNLLARSLYSLTLLAVFAVHAQPASVTYTYDGAARLRSTTFKCGAQKIYTLDAAGNRTSTQSSPATGAGQVYFASAPDTLSEANSSIQIQVMRECVSGSAASVSYALSGTAIQGSDYTISGSLSWAANDSSPKTLTLTSIDNAVRNPSKTVVITLSAPTGGLVIGTPSSITVGISDNDTSAQFANSAFPVQENAGTAEFSITRDGVTAGAPAATIQCRTTSGTATAGADFTDTTQAISWAQGDASPKTCSVPILVDGLDESSETFTVSLINPSTGISVGTPSSATVTINNVQTSVFSVSDSSILESVGAATVTVYRTNPNSSIPYQVNYAISSAGDSAVLGSDYSMGSGTSATGTLQFNNGVTSRTIPINIINDPIYEGPETFTISISNPTNGAIISQSRAIITIQDNDPGPVFAVQPQLFGEGTQGAITVTLIGATSFSHSITYATETIAGSADGSDYVGTSGTLTFAPGETTKQFPITISPDVLYEGPNETFNVRLTNATNGASIVSPLAAMTIQEDDLSPYFAINPSTSTTEGPGTSATFTVTKTGETALVHSINYRTFDGEAHGNSDYNPVTTPLTLTFAPQETSKTLSIGIINDNTHELTEDFRVELDSTSTTNGAYVAYGRDRGVATIADDDPPPPSLVALVSATTWNYQRTPPMSPVQSPPIVVSASGGSGGGYTFAWEKVSGDSLTTATAPTSSTTNFSRSQGAALVDYTSFWRCRVQDSAGNVVYTDQVRVNFRWDTR